MSTRLYRSFQASLLLGLFLFLVVKIINNQLLWYINLRSIILVQSGIVFLAVLVYRLFKEARQLHRSENKDKKHAREHNHSSPINLWVMLFPLLIGFLIPARPLDSSAVSAKGLTTSSPLVNSDSPSLLLEMEPEQRNVLDWVKLFYFEKNLEPYVGQQASVIGFVYFDERLPEGQFFVSRFTLACCAADGYAVGMIVEWPGTAHLEQDTWVQVKGPVEVSIFEGATSPLIRAEAVDLVNPPEQPYLYP